MAINQLHYMSLSMSVINYDDIRQRFLTNSKDEDISPFTAVDKYDVYYLSTALTMLCCHILSILIDCSVFTAVSCILILNLCACLL